MTDAKLTVAEIAEQVPPEFRQLLDALHARFRTKNFAIALDLVDRIGAAAEEMNHHPDLDLRWGRVDIRLTSHDTGWITDRDLTLAHRISELAAEVGATSDPESVQVVEYGLDTWASEEVAPFWEAILGYRVVGGVDLVDPYGAGPTVWLQSTDEHPAPQQRWHPDIWVPMDRAEARLEAALAAGGTLVDDSRAPTFWVLADPQGNKVCICTAHGRDQA